MKQIELRDQDRVERGNNHKENIVYPASMILPVLIFLGATAISGMLPGQKYCFLYGDGLLQFSIFSKAFAERLFEGKSLLYSFDIGLGMPTVALYAFYALSPFNLFYCIFSDIEVATLFVICGKLACSSMAMCFLLRRWLQTNKVQAIFLATAYGLGAFFTTFYMALELLDMLYLFPLLTWALIRFVKTGRWGKLCILYFLGFAVHFYTGYIVGVFSFVCLLTYSWHSYGNDVKKWKQMITGYFCCVLTAVLLSAPITLPAAVELFSMRSSDVTVLEQFGTDPLLFVRGFFLGQTQDIYNDVPMIYSGLLILVCSVLYLCIRNEKKKNIILALIPIVFLTACAFVKPLYLMIHGFDAPDGYAFRFSWMLDFCLILMTASVLQKKKEFTRKKVWTVAVVWSSLIVLLFVIQQWRNLTDRRPITEAEVILNICFLTFYAMILSGKALKDSKKDILLGAVMMVELCISIILGQADIRDEIYLRELYSVKQEQTEQGLAYIAEQEMQEKNDFYRVHYLNSIVDNISMEYGFKGLGWFSSIENRHIRNFLLKCGYAGNHLFVNDYGSTAFMRMLLSQKYSIECGFLETDAMEYFTVRKEPYSLPLGFMVADSVRGYLPEDMDPFALQNQLAGALCGEPHEIFHKHMGGFQVETEGIELLFPEGGVRMKRTSEDVKGQFVLEPEMEGQVYAYIGRWGIADLDYGSPLVYSEIDMGGMREYSRMGLPHNLPLWRGRDGRCRIYVAMSDVYENYDFEALYVAYEDPAEIQKVQEQLSENTMDMTDFRDDEIKGQVTVKGDKTILFTTIPFHENWKVYIDGKENETVALLGDTFLGVELTEGTHEVVFRYYNKWILYGMVLMFIGVLMFMGNSKISIYKQSMAEV